MTKHTRRVLELGVGLALALAIVLTVGADWHQRTAAQVRADTLRLHILANSDTLDDQLLKLQVRDAVLAALPPAVTKAATPDEAAAALQYALPALQQAADTALHRAHSPQAARLRLEQWDFAARDMAASPCRAGLTRPCALSWAKPGAATGSAFCIRLFASPVAPRPTPPPMKTRWCLEGLR